MKDDVIGRVAESVRRSFGDTAAANKSRCALDRCAKNQFAALRPFLESARGGKCTIFKIFKISVRDEPSVSRVRLRRDRGDGLQ